MLHRGSTAQQTPQHNQQHQHKRGSSAVPSAFSSSTAQLLARAGSSSRTLSQPSNTRLRSQQQQPQHLQPQLLQQQHPQQLLCGHRQQLTPTLRPAAAGTNGHASSAPPASAANASMAAASPMLFLPMGVLTDSYKASHFLQYPEARKMVAVSVCLLVCPLWCVRCCDWLVRLGGAAFPSRGQHLSAKAMFPLFAALISSSAILLAPRTPC